MQKVRKKIISILLILILIFSMAVPTFAERIFKYDTLAGKEWRYLAYRDSESASAEFEYDGDHQLTVSVTTYNWCNGHSEELPSCATKTGVHSIRATAWNVVTMDDGVTYHSCRVSYAKCSGKIINTMVVKPFEI